MGEALRGKGGGLRVRGKSGLGVRERVRVKGEGRGRGLRDVCYGESGIVGGMSRGEDACWETRGRGG